MGKIATAQITIADLSDPIISGSTPSSLVEDMLWLDTSVSPNVLKRYNNGAWFVVNDTSSLVTRITAAEQKITDDAIISTVTNSTKYLGLEQRVSSAESKLTADAMETTISNSTALSNVKQTADKINWIIASGESASAMQLTDDALTVIANNVDLSANNSVKISSANQITADAAKSIDLSANETVSIKSSGQISAEAASGIDLSSNDSIKITSTGQVSADVASGIDLSANNTIKISSADQIDISAVNALNLSSNGTITILTGDVSAAQKAADEAGALGFTASDDPPSAPDKNYRWLDTKNVPNQLRIWRGLETTPSGAGMTVATKIEESISATNNTIAIDNTNGSIVSNITITVTDSLKTESEIVINDETVYIEIDGAGNYSFEPFAVSYTITTDIAATTATYTCSGWKTINDTTSLSNQTSKAQDDATQALTNADSASKSAAAAQKSIDEFGDYIKISENSVDIINGTDANKRVSVSSSGVDIQTSDNNKVSITSQGVDIYAGGKKTSSFISNGVVLGNYFLWYPEGSGGLAFNVYEVT